MAFLKIKKNKYSEEKFGTPVGYLKENNIDYVMVISSIGKEIKEMVDSKDAVIITTEEFIHQEKNYTNSFRNIASPAISLIKNNLKQNEKL